MVPDITCTPELLPGVLSGREDPAVCAQPAVCPQLLAPSTLPAPFQQEICCFGI